MGLQLGVVGKDTPLPVPHSHVEGAGAAGSDSFIYIGLLKCMPMQELCLPACPCSYCFPIDMNGPACTEMSVAVSLTPVRMKWGHGLLALCVLVPH